MKIQVQFLASQRRNVCFGRAEAELEAEASLSTEVGTFELLNILDSRPTDRFDHLKRQENWGKEVSWREFSGFFNVDGVMVAEKRFRERVFFGGLTPEVRQRVRHNKVPRSYSGHRYLQGVEVSLRIVEGRVDQENMRERFSTETASL